MEQIDLARRYLKRIKRIYKGMEVLSYQKKDFQDDVQSFFIHCYHIKDWILALNRISVSKEEVDSYIDQHMPLRICVDMANAAKHCKLTRTTRTNRKPHIISTEFRAVTLAKGDIEIIKVRAKYTLVSDNTTYDVLEIAIACMQLWDRFTDELNQKFDRMVAAGEIKANPYTD